MIPPGPPPALSPDFFVMLLSEGIVKCSDILSRTRTDIFTRLNTKVMGESNLRDFTDQVSSP